MPDTRILRLVKADARLREHYIELSTESGDFAREWIDIFRPQREEDVIYNLAVLYRRLRDGQLSQRARTEISAFSRPADDLGINIDDSFTEADVEVIAQFFTRLQVVEPPLMQSIEVVATRVSVTSPYRGSRGGGGPTPLPADPLAPQGGDMFGDLAFGADSDVIPSDPYPGDAADPNGPGDNADPTMAQDIRTILAGLGTTVETLVALVRLLLRLFRGGDTAFQLFMNTSAMLKQVPVEELERRTRPSRGRGIFPW